MPNFSGIWTVTQQMQAKGASTWPATPGAPTIGTATAGSSLCASVTFTAPSCIGYPATGITGYRVISTPGCITATGASSPLTVTGLTSATSYTFKAQATNATGYGPLSAASNSITATNANSQSYTTAGTYSWVAPSGVTTVSVVAVGGGQGGSGDGAPCGTIPPSGQGGSLRYVNNISVTPGNSYSVVVGSAGTLNTAYRGTGGAGGTSRFNTSSVVAPGGNSGTCGVGTGGDGGLRTTNIGTERGGGGAGGYSGNGGRGGATLNCKNATAGTGGAGGGGGGGGGGYGAPSSPGGGVGLFGQGSNGGAGASAYYCCGCGNVRSGGGGGGSGGTSGGNSCVTGGVYSQGNPGLYGGGGAQKGSGPGTNGASGAVRIMWPGNTRSFPSTCAGSP